MDENIVYFTKTKKGKSKVCHAGYAYNYSKSIKLGYRLSFYIAYVKNTGK